MMAMASAQTLSRDNFLFRRSCAGFFFSKGSFRAKAKGSENFFSLGNATHLGWYLYCFLLLSSMPVACKCPLGDAQIQTSRQAGGSTSERIRASICELVIGWSSLSRYTRLFPLAFRLYPFCWGDV